MDYKRIKKIDIRQWLLRSNAKLYAFILVIFLAAVIFMFNTVGSMFDQQDDQGSDEQVQSESTTSYVAENQSYQIRINKSQNFITIYRIDDNGEFTTPYKVFWCSVNSSVSTGSTTITDKSIWRKFSDQVYGHYSCKLDSVGYLHSVPYSAQDNSKLIVSAYNRLGSAAQLGSIYMAAADAKWIYENCGIGTTVEIYEDESETPALTLEELETLAAGTAYDPSDQTLSNTGTTANYKINYMTGVNDAQITINQEFNEWAGIYAVDKQGNDITSDITITGAVDTTTEGTYTLIYHLSDNYGTTLNYYRYITVVAETQTQAETETQPVSETQSQTQASTQAPSVTQTTTDATTTSQSQEQATQQSTQTQTTTNSGSSATTQTQQGSIASTQASE